MMRRARSLVNAKNTKPAIENGIPGTIGKICPMIPPMIINAASSG